jgi:5-methylcytosine-specific restriction protein A
MSQIESLRPTSKELVINLVHAAGIDVSDWSNYSGGAVKAASNPRYCYEWAFADPGKVVVLNLWHELLRDEGGAVFQELNMRQTARNLKDVSGITVQIRRALTADEHIRHAFKGSLPVRVVINDGVRRQERTRGSSRVRARTLDTMVWHVGAYDFVSGTAIIVRGERGNQYVDQFAVQPDSGAAPRKNVEAMVYVRDSRVRAAVLRRAAGKCEHCGEPGFSMPNSAVYLETHHVVPLSEDGPDTEANVLALCPNHHRRAHHGIDRAELRVAFLTYLDQRLTGA